MLTNIRILHDIHFLFIEPQMVHLKDSLAHQWIAGHSLCSGGQCSALTREDPSLDTDCATAMAPPL